MVPGQNSKNFQLTIFEFVQPKKNMSLKQFITHELDDTGRKRQWSAPAWTQPAPLNTENHIMSSTTYVPSGNTTTNTNTKDAQLGSSRVNPNHSIIIRNVQARKFTNSSNIKTEFNKHFKDIAIKSCFSTQAGNIIVELCDTEDVARVLGKWDARFFATNMEYKTYAVSMKASDNTKPQVEALVKRVDKDLSEQYIADELERKYQRPTIRRFVKKDNFVLSTIKVDFQSPMDYKKALNEGITIGYRRYSVEPYIKPPNVLQCYRCKRFGHTFKWCTRNPKCKFCTKGDHEDVNCRLKGDIDRYKCINCDGAHSATYHQCPIYINHAKRSHQKRTDHDQ
jgi:hypothetical protein